MHLVNVWRMVVLVVQHDNGVDAILNLCAGSTRTSEVWVTPLLAAPVLHTLGFLLSIGILHVEVL